MPATYLPVNVRHPYNRLATVLALASTMVEWGCSSSPIS